MSGIEQILLNRVKIIEDDSWSLVGSPNNLIKELENLLAQQVKEAVKEESDAILTDLLDIIGEDEPKPDHPDDNAYSDEDIDAIVRNQLRQELREKIKAYYD